MERTWKQTLIAGIVALLLVAVPVLAGGKFFDSTAVTSQETSEGDEEGTGDQQDSTVHEIASAGGEEQAEDGNADEDSDALDPNDPAIIGKAGGDNSSASGGTKHTSGKAGGSSSTDSSTETQDQYHTDPVPDGRPEPVEPDDEVVDTSTTGTCTISISCDTILDNMDQCKENKRSLVPSDGVILPATTVTFSSGESVYDILQEVCKDNNIHMESKFTPMYNSAYIQGINNLYEFDVGSQSGWMYKVNGWFPNYGCSRYQVQDGDVICWVYTCDLGSDVGDNSMSY